MEICCKKNILFGLNQKITDEKLKWNQDKTDTVWRKCKAFYEDRDCDDVKMLLGYVSNSEEVGIE